MFYYIGCLRLFNWFTVCVSCFGCFVVFVFVLSFVLIVVFVRWFVGFPRWLFWISGLLCLCLRLLLFVYYLFICWLVVCLLVVSCLISVDLDFWLFWFCLGVLLIVLRRRYFVCFVIVFLFNWFYLILFCVDLPVGCLGLVLPWFVCGLLVLFALLCWLVYLRCCVRMFLYILHVCYCLYCMLLI